MIVVDIYDRIIERGYDLNIWGYARVDTVNERMLAKMKRAGIYCVAYGFESGSKKVPDVVTKGYKQEVMQKAVKMTYDTGLYIIGNFIFGLPDDDYESMRETLDFTFFRLAALSYVGVYMGGLDERLFFSTYVGALLIAPFLVAEVIKAMRIRLKTSKGWELCL